MSECSGDIIGFLDTDDYWSESKLKDQIDIFEREPKVDCVYTKFWVKYENFFIPNKLYVLTKIFFFLLFLTPEFTIS